MNATCCLLGFDRELSVAGCVIVKTAAGGFVRKLIHCKRPVMRVPNLCIHLQSAAERSSFTINKETHLTRPLPPLFHFYFCHQFSSCGSRWMTLLG